MVCADHARRSRLILAGPDPERLLCCVTSSILFLEKIIYILMNRLAGIIDAIAGKNVRMASLGGGYVCCSLLGGGLKPHQ